MIFKDRENQVGGVKNKDLVLQNKVDMIFKDRENQVGGVKNKDFGAVSQTGLTSV